MTNKSVIVLIVLIVLAASKEELEVLSVSSSPQVIQNPVKSSHVGGRRIYIQVVGHSLDVQKLDIKFGDYPCEIIDEGVTSDMITCRTTSADKKTAGYHYIKLTSDGQTVTKEYPHVITYSTSDTPTLQECETSSSSANKKVTCEGIHETNTVGQDPLDVGDIEVVIGQSVANRYNVSQPTITGTSANEPLNFQVEEDLEAGNYNISTSGETGVSEQNAEMTRASLNGSDNFQFTTLPAITNVTSEGNVDGQEIEIEGSGFSTNKSNNTVSVDGDDCVVTASTSTQIKCTLKPNASSPSQKLDTNDTNQNQGYTSGSGLHYKRFATSTNNIFSFVSAVRAGGGGSLEQQGYRSELKSMGSYGQYKGQFWKGYFTPPTTGSYTFRGWATYAFAFYISPTYGSVNVPTTAFISSPAYQGVWTNFFYDNIATASGTIQLVANRSYYIQAYYISYYYTGNFKIMVEVPNNDSKLAYQTYQVEQIQVSTDHQPEVMVYTMAGSIGGSINLKIVRTDSNGKITYNVNRTIPYGCSASTFNNHMAYFGSFSYSRSTTMKAYDANNQTTSNTSNTTRYEYHVSFARMRPQSYQTQRFIVTPVDGYSGTFDQVQLIKHSPLMEGPFELDVGDVLYKLNINSYGSISLTTTARKLGYQNVNKQFRTVNGYQYDVRAIISYRGVYHAIPNATITSNVTGGINTPTVIHKILRNYSTNIIFDPVDYRFLSTAASNPTIKVKTNDIPATCMASNSCSYNSTEMFKVISMNITGSVLSISLSNPLLFNISFSAIAIKAGDHTCSLNTTQQSTILNITCQLSTNADGTPILSAGDFQPEVFISGFGYVGRNASVAPIKVPFAATSLDISSGSNNGGYPNTLRGTGFRAQKNDNDADGSANNQNKMKITLCGQLVQIDHIANKFIDFVVPPCNTTGLHNVSVTDGTHTDANLTFNYTAPSPTAPNIAGLTKMNSNPALKTTIKVMGSNFGTNLSAVRAFLTQNSLPVYELRVLSITDNQVSCGLPGGLPGTYYLQLKFDSSGDAVIAAPDANQFNYSSGIISISPNTGSIYGGTYLTIIGQNFLSTQGDTHVYIGDAINWFCTILTINSTYIRCLTPPIHPIYLLSNSIVDVVVASKLTTYATCINNCSYIYQDISFAANFSILSSANVTGGSQINVSGSKFINGGGNCTAAMRSKLDNKITILTSLTCNDTHASYTIPKSLITGNYYISIKNGYGDSNPKDILVKWIIGSFYISQGSIEGGFNSIFGGSGFPLVLDNNFQIFVTTADKTLPPIEITQCCTDNIMNFIFPKVPNGTLYTFTFTSPIETITRSFSVSQSVTTFAKVIQPSNLTFNPNVDINITLNRTSTAYYAINNISFVSTINSSDITQPTSWAKAFTTITNITIRLNAGSYKMIINSTTGYYQINEVINVNLPSMANSNNQVASFAGGLFWYNGSGISPSSYITVNGLKGYIVHISSILHYYQLPELVAPEIEARFGWKKKVGKVKPKFFSLFSDSNLTGTQPENILDNKKKTYYKSNNTQCWIGLDVGMSLTVKVRRIKFFSRLLWRDNSKVLQGAQFQGSNDMSTWKTLAIVTQRVHRGWNVIRMSVRQNFRFIRFRHDSTSQCSLAEMRVFGVLKPNKNINLTSVISTVSYNDGFNQIVLASTVEYREDKTATIDSIVPPYGDIFGGYPITLHGTNLNFSSTVNIVIDGINCVFVNSTTTTITCTVGAKPSTSVQDNFLVEIGGKQPFVHQRFTYVLKWSDIRTWGTDLPPIKGDLVYVPAGKVLLIDQDTPELIGIAAKNASIFFPNNTNITVKTGFITVIGGSLIAGTEAHPLNSNLTFILSGDYYGPQLPQAGNKGIFCLQCKLSIYGQPRTKTWTTLETTISSGATTFNVTDVVDWQVGEQIAIASTSFNHHESETAIITAINGKLITVKDKFKYKHEGFVETHGSQQLTIKAEIALLSRNIKIKGDSATSSRQYGAHLKVTGSQQNGLEAHVAYTEFTLCGQPQIPGRHCINFHMTGEVPNSFVRGNSIHESLSRAVALQHVKMLTVQDNVAFRVRGHNFFLKDGTQTDNVIRYNLAISSLKASIMLQSDISVASFMITNPSNDVYGNVAAGSDFYGFWYHLSKVPQGASATADICPQGLPLGNVSHNVIHSIKHYGMRINRLIARTYPCLSIRNDGLFNDPWAQNPSMVSTLSNFLIYRNGDTGLLAEYTGHFSIQNFMVAQNRRVGIQFYVSNFTKEHTQVINSTFIGQTTASGPVYSYTKGLVTPRTGSTNLTGVHFYSFPNGTTALIICSQCDQVSKFTNLGTQLFVRDIHYAQIEGRFMRMQGLKRDVIYDLDGSVASAFGQPSLPTSTIVAAYNHITKGFSSQCSQASSNLIINWDYLTLCDNTLTIRRIWFTNAVNNTGSSFYSQNMYVVPVTNATSSFNWSHVTYISARMSGSHPRIQKPQAWALPFVIGQNYQAWWSSYYDFDHLSIVTTPIYGVSEPGTVFKFAYFKNRQFYELTTMRGGSLSTSLMLPSNNYLDPMSCQNGNYYHNNDNNNTALRMIQVCQSGKNKTKFQYTQINAIFCRFMCPKPVPTYNSSCNSTSKQSFVRRWSNASQWPNQTLPLAGEDVVIWCDWTMLIDVNPERIGTFTVDGDLVVDDTFDIKITAEAVFIRAGSLTVGNSSNPFTHKFSIQINGQQNSTYANIDALISANKYFVVTGSLSLHGKKPTTTSTYLKKTSIKGSSVIYPYSISGWAIGDSLSLSPSFTAYDQFQEIIIKDINTTQNSIVTMIPLKYTHFGDTTTTISTTYGSLDARTRVGHLTRNIKIVSGISMSYGFTMYVYKMYDDKTSKIRVGNLILSAVELRNGGQQGFSSKAALQFTNVIDGASTSQVVDSAFANCQSWCISVSNSRDITITNTILFNAKGTGISITGNTQSLIFNNNLIVGVSSPSSTFSRVTACLAYYRYNDPTYNNQIKNNVCQGSQGYGFLLPHVKCNQLETHTMTNNLAGSCVIGFIFNSISDNCQGFSKIQAYSCRVGQISGPPDTQALLFTNFILADNQRAGTLKFGGIKRSLNNTAVLNNSYITAISRPSCPDCYPHTDCTNNYGLRLLSVTENGLTVSDRFISQMDYISSPAAFDAKVYMNNVIFKNYRQKYSTGFHSTIATNCGPNFAFRTHPSASDATGGHYLFNCECQNCDNSSFAFCQSSSPTLLGNNGCGSIECTGKSNYLIQDWSGTFFGQKGTLLPNNKVMGNNEANCVANTAMNAHLCARQDFVILEYESSAKDNEKRVIWPVTLEANNSNYKTVINAGRQWGARLGRFVSVVKLYNQYNMTFASMPPLDMQMQLQRRTPKGNGSNWILVKIYFPLPNSIRIFVNGIRKSPIITTDLTVSQLKRSIDTFQCGDNIYYFKNRTIKILVTEGQNCLIKLSVADSIQLTTHFAMNASDFFVDSVMSNFINNLAALLGISDQSRIKIVGVHSGSTVVQTVIQADNTTDSTPNSSPDISNISAALQDSINDGSYSTVMQNNVGYPVISATQTLFITPDTTASQNNDSNDVGSNMVIIIAIIAGSVVVLGLFVLIYCIYKHKMKAKEEYVANDLDKESQIVEKDKSRAIIMSDDVFFGQNSYVESATRAEPSPKKKNRNRRARTRQILQIRQFD